MINAKVSVTCACCELEACVRVDTPDAIRELNYWYVFNGWNSDSGDDLCNYCLVEPLEALRRGSKVIVDLYTNKFYAEARGEHD